MTFLSKRKLILFYTAQWALCICYIRVSYLVIKKHTITKTLCYSSLIEILVIILSDLFRISLFRKCHRKESLISPCVGCDSKEGIWKMCLVILCLCCTPHQNFYWFVVIFLVRNFFSEEMATIILAAKGAGSPWKSYLSISQMIANFDCCFIWVRNLVSHTGGGT
jgi:hypothetical protein